MMSDYLERYKSLEADKIKILRYKCCSLKQSQIKYFKCLLSPIYSFLKTNHINTDSDIIEIGVRDELKIDEYGCLIHILQQLKPWKKGPFNIFGILIDAEWRSNYKWHRICPVISDYITNKRIMDIGCNNGYFAFKMLRYQPQLIIGLEPYEKYRAQSDLLAYFFDSSYLYVEPFGVEHIDVYYNFFDLILFMGVIYHLKNPCEVLFKVHAALRRGGKLILESQGIMGDDPIALIPESRYANAKGIWFVPTEKYLINLLKRCDFKRINCFYKHVLTTDEQRSTLWAPISSLSEGLDSNDLSKTIEGYPAPIRIYIEAYK